MKKYYGSSVAKIYVALFFLICSLGISVAADENKTLGESFEIHGRLSISNGNPMYRIWIVDTDRLLGVPGGDIDPAKMPEKLEKLFTDTSINVYGDFTVKPLSEYEPGVMQFVIIESAKDLSVYNADGFIKKIGSL